MAARCLEYRRVTLDWSLFGNTTAGRGSTYDGVNVVGTLRANMPEEVNKVNVSFNSPGSAVDWADPFWDIDRSWKMIDVTGTSQLTAGFFVPTVSFLDGQRRFRGEAFFDVFEARHGIT